MRIFVYVKKSLKFDRMQALENEHLQTIWIKCGFKNAKPSFVCQGYREYTSNLGASMNHQSEKLVTFLDQWESAISYGNPSEPNDVFILCDMNLDSYLDRWKDPNYRLYYLSQQVLRFCNANNIDQLVSGVTRAQYNGAAQRTLMSCLDHIYTNVSHKCSSPQVVSFGDSDHDLISFVRLSKPPPEVSRTIRRRSYTLFDREQFLSDLVEIDWTDVLICQDIDAATEIFTNKFRSVLDCHAPWITFQQRKLHKPWITPQTLDLMKERDHLKKFAINLCQQNASLGPTQEEIDAWNKFKILRNRINNLKKKEVNNYKKQVLANCDGDSKLTWDSVKAFMDWKGPASPHQLVVENKFYRKSKEVANLLNEFFIGKIKSLRDNFQDQEVNLEGCKRAMHSKRCSLSLSFTSVFQVEKVLRKLKSSKAVAIDGLDTYSLKMSAKIVALPIHHLISLSLMQQKVPSLWKLAKVLPIHKKGDILNRKNYRPVCILSPVSKVLERIVYDQLYTYFSVNKIFHQNIMGYRKHRSTITATLQMYDRWIQAAGQGKISGVVLLDLSAAFDLVNPSILLEKLSAYGLNEDFIGWINCYLSNRRQAVWVDHVLSDWHNVDIGVPQGSILGPLLFLIFSNDLPFLLSCSLDQYADDCTLTSVKNSVGEINMELNRDCGVVSNWMQKNHLCLNVEKTHIMLCGTSQKLAHINRAGAFEVSMDDRHLTESANGSEKILGIHMQSNLKWTKHCQDLQARLKSRIAGLCKVKHILVLQKRKVVAQAIFQSVLTYCIALWGGASKGVLEDLQVLQNMAARFVLCVDRRVSRCEMYKQLGWMTVHQLVIFHRILAVYQIRKIGEPKYLASSLMHDNIRGNIVIPVTGLTLLQKSFMFNGGQSWNRVPANIRQLSSLVTFKKELKEWVLVNIELFV